MLPEVAILPAAVHHHLAKAADGARMAIKAQIGCSGKIDGDGPWERITHIGGVNPDGSRWKMTQERAVYLMEEGWEFYVAVDGKAVWCEVAISGQGNKYIKTATDDELPSNLLALPECP